MGAAEDFNKTMKQIQIAAKDIQSPTSLKLIAVSARNQIVKRTRLGFGADRAGGQKKKLAPLSKSYKAQRKGQVAFYTDSFGRLRKIDNPSIKPKLSSTTSGGKSNLTFSGDMLKNIGFTIGGKVITIGAKAQKQKEKVFFAHEGSKNRPERKFLFLTDKETLKVAQLVDKLFDLALSKRIGG